MSRRHHIVFLGAALVATLGACHAAKPVTSVSASSYQAQPAGADGQDASAREVAGYAPSARLPSPQPATRAPARTPAPAPALVPQDDSMRLFDMP
jgi:hypothetical protein